MEKKREHCQKQRRKNKNKKGFSEEARTVTFLKSGNSAGATKEKKLRHFIKIVASYF